MLPFVFCLFLIEIKLSFLIYMHLVFFFFFYQPVGGTTPVWNHTSSFLFFICDMNTLSLLYVVSCLSFVARIQKGVFYVI